MTAQRPSRASIGRTAGVEAMFIMAAVMLALRLLLGIPTLPELFSDTVLYLIPAPVFSATLDALRFDAKYLLLVLLFLGQLGVGALAGWYLASSSTALPDARFRQIIGSSLSFAGLAWLVTVLALMPLLGAGFMGADTTSGPTVTLVGYAITDATFAVAFAWLFPLLQRAQLVRSDQVVVSLRAVLRQLGLGIVGLAVATLGLKAIGTLLPTASAKPAGMPPPITPPADFYVVSKNLLGVQVDLGRWSLDVIGSGGRVAKVGLADLKAMPATEVTSTLTCISNLVGGNLIGTARWTGVRLRDVIGVPGPSESVVGVVLTGWDDYSDSIPIAKALDPNTVLVYAMDGQPLPMEHGFPARLIVPGLYGIKNVKWVKRIEVVAHGFVGYWQSRGWSETAVVQTQSQIDEPGDRSVLPLDPVDVGGIAFAGIRGIATVELSVDGGASWFATTLQPALSPFSWTTWTTRWSPGAPGRFDLVVRATDGTGQLQPAANLPPIPEGATGYHRIGVRVA